MTQGEYTLDLPSWVGCWFCRPTPSMAGLDELPGFPLHSHLSKFLMAVWGPLCCRSASGTHNCLLNESVSYNHLSPENLPVASHLTQKKSQIPTMTCKALRDSHPLRAFIPKRQTQPNIFLGSHPQKNKTLIQGPDVVLSRAWLLTRKELNRLVATSP